MVYVNSIRFKQTDSSCHFVEVIYRGLNLNFLILKQLPIDGNIESNPWPTQNDFKSPVGLPKKMKVFKGTSKKCDLSENNVNVASNPKAKNYFSKTIQAVRLKIIKPWWVTCPSFLESLQKLEFQVSNDINSIVSLCQGDATKLSVDIIVISAIKAWIVGGVIDSNIHEAARSGLLNECQKLKGCETGKCKVTLGHNLSAKYVFHAVRPRAINDHNLNGCY